MTQPANAPRTIRCGIYTRKSTDEGLDQDFNTLDAQREAAEAYIASQHNEGWAAIPNHYDDGGFTGGNMERPALQRLLRDIEEGKVDCLVVYKVDRLSRSLLDFARLIEVLDRHSVTFISVTQQFNTTNSMGRLTLNILLSFAQFERELISERTRDKMSAARRKGKWTGGMLILGYDVDKAKRLMVNEAEAARVREIFELYLRERSLIPTVKELARRGWTTKRWQTGREVERGGKPFDKNSLFFLLTNITYTGKTEYKGEIYEGEHPAIVSEDVWQRVQNRLHENQRTGGADVRNKYGGLLKSLLYCEACDAAMIHSYTNKGAKRYRYYVCSHAQKNGWDTCPTKSLPASEIERIVIQSIRAIGADDQLASEAIGQARKKNEDRLRFLETQRDSLTKDLAKFNEDLRQLATSAKAQSPRGTAFIADLNDRIREAEQQVTRIREKIVDLQGTMIDEGDMRAAFSIFDPMWDGLTPKEKVRVMHLLVERVGFNPETSKISITFRPTGSKSLRPEELADVKKHQEETTMVAYTFDHPVHIQLDRKGRKRLMNGKCPEAPSVEPGNIPRISKLMALAIRFEERVEKGEVRDLAQLAMRGHVTRARMTQIMNLRLLAPDIQEALLSLPRTTKGRDPIQYRHIRAITLDPVWSHQRRMWEEVIACSRHWK